MEVEVTVETEEAHRHLAGDADRIVHALRSLGFEIDRVQINFSHQQAQSASAQSDRQPQLQGGASGNGGGHDRNGGPSRGTGGEAVPGDNDVQDQRPRQRDLYI
jgi:chemotaxis protein MotD